MSLLSPDSQITEVDDPKLVVTALRRELTALRSMGGERVTPIERVAVRTVRLDPLLWLASQYGSDGGDGEAGTVSTQQVYWASRNGDYAVAGLGVVDEVSGDRFEELTALRQRIATISPGVRYYGGLRFDDEAAVSTEWSAFGGFRFVLPRIEVESHADWTEIRVTVRPDSEEDVRAAIREVDALTFEDLSISVAPISPVYREDLPDLAGWTRNIEWSLDAFSRTRLGKIVLARRATFGFSSVVDPAELLSRLRGATSNCYHFLFNSPDGSAFVGASPERLFKLSGSSIWSEAVAGTRPRGATEGDDDQLRDELLLSEKDQREHQFVRQSIKDTLAGMCSELEVDVRPSEMKLARGRHLVSRVRGELAPEFDAIDLVTALHPTPAVGGHPTPDAVRAIARLEPFDRGWYASPVGWVAADGAEFAVGIRSGLVHGKRLSLYSGAGIVGGSTPESEWAEIENKILDFISVFDSDEPSGLQ
ncbi:MAG: isochorismate synthase [Rhodothermales bacterium]